MVNAAKDRELEIQRQDQEKDTRNEKRRWEGRVEGSLKREETSKKPRLIEFKRNENKWYEKCRKKHVGACESVQNPPRCYKCGKIGHMSRNCTSNVYLCFNCGESDHFAVNCPKPKTDMSKNVGRNNHGEVRGVKKEEGRGNITRGRAFQMTAEQARYQPDVVSSTFILNSLPVYAVFDSGATFSLIASRFAEKLNISSIPLIDDMIVETVDGSEILIKKQYVDCRLEIDGNVFLINLKPIFMREFDIVIGMDWLASNNAQIVCNKKLLVIESPNGPKITIHGERRFERLPIISLTRVKNDIRKGGVVYIAYVTQAEPKKRSIYDNIIVKEYSDVFPEELPGLPPDRQIESAIDVTLGANPIARSPYRLAPSEMEELRNQLQELLD